MYLKVTITIFFILLYGVSNMLGQLATKNTLQEAVLNEATHTYHTPALFELMQIAIALGNNAVYSGDMDFYYNVVDTSKAYYKEVINYFKPYAMHPLVHAVHKALKKNPSNYIYNLHKAYNSKYVQGTVKKHYQFELMQRLPYLFNSVKRSLIKDFAHKSNFEQFYKQHYNYYMATLQDVHNKVNATKVQQWLQHEFKPTMYDGFTIVISPLMNNFHYTKNVKYKGKRKAIMWVCDANDSTAITKYNRDVWAGIYLGIVFTEIDHNYVNPASDKYKDTLNKLMGGQYRNKWVGNYGDASYYPTGYKVFNEYMTHAVYLLYTNSIYDNNTQQLIELNRVTLMGNKRGFKEIAIFYELLKELYNNKKANETIVDLYPEVISLISQYNNGREFYLPHHNLK
jgi:hypothetical protein